MAIRRVDHVNIVTSDLEGTRAFFVDNLALTVGPRPPFEVQGYWLYAGETAVVHLQVALKTVGASVDSALNHFAFDVDDLASMLERLQNNGVAFREARVPDSDVHQAFLFDPNGVRIELNYRP
jgi:catechol 2,3-dioxygenase-like lactoylglutathione lyase family enzyme